jgi:phosphoglycerol transferase MdoB-like AlkP superfamily enzyme
MGRLGGEVRHQCWGRDLLNLPAGDGGIGVIKPSGGDQTVAIVSPERILIQPKGFDARLYDYQLGAKASATRVDLQQAPELKHKLEAFLQTATKSLLDNTAGVVDSKPE